MICVAGDEDREQVMAIAAEAGNFAPYEVECVKELWQAYREKGERSGYIFVVCRSESEDRVLGFACFGPHALTEGVYDLYWIATAPTARRQGVGRSLIAYVENAVQARGGRLLVVETSSTLAYAPARRFYEACGYRYEAVIHDFYHPGDDMLVYVKQLAAPRERSIFRDGAGTERWRQPLISKPLGVLT